MKNLVIGFTIVLCVMLGSGENVVPCLTSEIVSTISESQDENEDTSSLISNEDIEDTSSLISNEDIEETSCDDVGTDGVNESLFLNWIFPIILEFVSAFLGIFLAFIVTRRKDRKDFILMEDKLIEELKTIKSELEDVKDKEEYVFYYITPGWEIYLESGGLTSFYSRYSKNSRKNSKQFKKCEKIINVYYSISYAKKLEENYYYLINENNNKLQNDYCKKLNSLRKAEMEKIYKSITEIERGDE